MLKESSYLLTRLAPGVGSSLCALSPLELPICKPISWSFDGLDTPEHVLMSL